MKLIVYIKSLRGMFPNFFWIENFPSEYLLYCTKFELESEFDLKSKLELKLGNYALQVRTMDLICMKTLYKTYISDETYSIYLVFKRYTPKQISELKNSIQIFIVSY